MQQHCDSLMLAATGLNSAMAYQIVVVNNFYSKYVSFYASLVPSKNAHSLSLKASLVPLYENI